jgi:hypothetical protein
MRKRSKAQQQRAIELMAIEAAYELKMNDRIITESAAIRAEWCDQVRESRRVQKGQPLQFKERHVPEQWGKGVEFQ